MLTSHHHPILEEIGRLEAERDRINAKIKQLRDTLPKEPVQAKIVGERRREQIVSVPTAQAPIATLMAQPPKPIEPQISDHAVIRYLERAYGFDFNGIREKIFTEKVKMAVRIGARAVKIDGGKLIIDGPRVVTFVSKSQPIKVRKGKGSAR
jgi:hypothetical protein